mgnify:CR=1 FL=1
MVSGRHRSRSWWTLVALAGIGLLSPPLSLAAPKKATALLLLLVDDDKAISSDSLLLTLSTQLAPDGIRTQRSRWTPRGDDARRARLARQIGDAASADYALFYRLDAKGSLRAVVLDLREDATWQRSLTLGAPSFGITRSLAAAVATLLRSRLGVPARSRPATRPSSRPTTRPTPPPATRPPTVAPAPIPLPRVLVEGRYAVGLLLGPGSWRQGPEVGLGARPWRRLEVLLTGALRLRQEGHAGAVGWSRSGLGLGLEVRWRAPLARRWDLLLGIHGGALRVAAEAAEGSSTVSQALWELHLGAAVGVGWRWSRHLGSNLAARLTWLPRGHEIAVAGREVARSGGGELSLAVTVWTGL